MQCLYSLNELGVRQPATMFVISNTVTFRASAAAVGEKTTRKAELENILLYSRAPACIIS